MANIVSFLKIEQNKLKSNQPPSNKERENDLLGNVDTIEKSGSEHLEDTYLMHLNGESSVPNEEKEWFGKLLCYCWPQIRYNTNAICSLYPYGVFVC